MESLVAALTATHAQQMEGLKGQADAYIAALREEHRESLKAVLEQNQPLDTQRGVRWRGTIPPFSGTSSECVLEFLNRAEREFRLQNLTDKGLQLEACRAALTGAAHNWSERASASKDYTDFPTFKKKIIAAFDDPEKEANVRIELQKLKMDSKQGLNAYIDEFRRIISRTTTMHVTDIVHRFQEGLIPALRRKLLERWPGTLEEAILDARNIERGHRLTRGGGQTFERRYSTPDASGPTPMDLTQMQTKFCYVCGDPSHFVRRCPKRATKPAGNASQQ